MSATEIIGIRAAVDGVECASEWRGESEAFDNAVYCSASVGAPVRSTGNKDWRGSWRAYGATPYKTPTQLFTFSGATRLQGDGSAGDGWESISNGAIVERVTIDWPVELGKFIEHELRFAAAEGALTATATWTADSSIPNPVSCVSMGATFNSVPITNVTHMRLILIGKNGFIPADSSSSGRAVRKPGNLDAIAIVRNNIPSFASLPAEDTIADLLIGVKDGQTPYTLRYAQFMGASPVVDMEGENGKPKFVGADLRFAWTSYYNLTQGYITGPGGTIWPTA